MAKKNQALKAGLSLMALIALLMSCEKSFFNKYGDDLSPAFRIEKQFIGSDKKTDTITVESSKENANKAVQMQFETRGDAVLLSLGGQAADTSIAQKLQLTLLFNATTDPYDIPGTYKFPSDNKQISLSISSYDGHGWQTYTDPVAGTFTINYDLLSLTWNGAMSDVRFRSADDVSQTTCRADFRYIKFGAD